MASRILVCDDEELIRWSLHEHLEAQGHLVDEASNGQECLDKVAEASPDAIVLDLKMPEMGGLDVLKRLREMDVQVPVMVITAHGAIDSAVEATRLGAAAYLSKPFDLREVTLQLERAIRQSRLAQEVLVLRGQQMSGYDQIVGDAPAMHRVFHVLRRLEDVDAPTVLISGESGTGKDLIAQAIHSRGPRNDGPYMAVDCAALPAQLIESELFGHERGAFTDAKQMKRGLFEVARGGTIFLDEIGELEPPTQAKLLRALESRAFKRVGGVQDLPLDATVIAATNRNLKTAVEEGRFREDLYFRLNVIEIVSPPLRERSSDVPALVEHFLTRFARRLGREVEGISKEAMGLLQRYSWPGNVRELRNLVERLVILEGAANVLRKEHLPHEILAAVGMLVPGDGQTQFLLPEEGVVLDEVERSFIEQALERTRGNQSAAARLLGISRYALRYRMEKHGLQLGGESPIETA